MTMRKITLTLPDSLIEAAEAAVAAGRARSVSAYVAAAAGTGEARLNLAEVLERWEADLGRVHPDPAHAAEKWVAEMTARSDQRYAARQARNTGQAA